MRVGGDEFTATDAELDEYGSRPYVTEVRQQAAPKAAEQGGGGTGAAPGEAEGQVRQVVEWRSALAARWGTPATNRSRRGR